MELELVIERGMETFVEVGSALLTIRDDRLYLPKNGGQHDTFEDYCQDRWGFSRQRAHQMIEAASVVGEMSKIFDTPPQRESHAAAFAHIPDPESRADVWKRAVGPACAPLLIGAPRRCDVKPVPYFPS